VAVIVKIPTPLRRVTNGASQALVDGGTVKDVVLGLEREFPGIGARLLNDEGDLRRTVNFYVNGEDVRFLKGGETSLKSGDEVSIVPAIAGGL